MKHKSFIKLGQLILWGGCLFTILYVAPGNTAMAHQEDTPIASPVPHKPVTAHIQDMLTHWDLTQNALTQTERTSLETRISHLQENYTPTEVKAFVAGAMHATQLIDLEDGDGLALFDPAAAVDHLDLFADAFVGWKKAPTGPAIFEENLTTFFGHLGACYAQIMAENVPDVAPPIDLGTFTNAVYAGFVTVHESDLELDEEDNEFLIQMSDEARNEDEAQRKTQRLAAQLARIKFVLVPPLTPCLNNEEHVFFLRATHHAFTIFDGNSHHAEASLDWLNVFTNFYLSSWEETQKTWALLYDIISFYMSQSLGADPKTDFSQSPLQMAHEELVQHDNGVYTVPLQELSMHLMGILQVTLSDIGRDNLPFAGPDIGDADIEDNGSSDDDLVYGSGDSTDSADESSADEDSADEGSVDEDAAAAPAPGVAIIEDAPESDIPPHAYYRNG